MKMSHLFGSTLREMPAGVESASHQLLVRAGFIRQLGQGLYSYLPLARRALNKIERILREEMEAIGGQEMTMPVVHPAEVWQATGRWSSIGPEMGRFKDRKGRDMALAMTHEEVVADLCRSEVHSYRQLPMLVYHLQTKFRDDPRPRAGLIRVREFTMKDSYSLDTDEAGLDRQYQAHYDAYFRIFRRCGLPVIAVGSDVGMMGGSQAHEYMYLNPIGEDTIVLCSRCGYSANRQIAEFRKERLAVEEPLAIERVATPGTTTIEDLAAFLGVPPARTAKAVMLVAGYESAAGTTEEFVFCVVRGDMELNETKLTNALHADWLRPAQESEIRAAGAVPGYASPIGVAAKVVIDEAVAWTPNLVAGANEAGFHLRNTNAGRDYQASLTADIAAACDGNACVHCGAPLSSSRGVEVGNIFKLGTRYSEAVGAMYLAADGSSRPVVMGSYGIGVGRLLACIAEEHHDERGLRWPVSVAPFDVYLVPIGAEGFAAADPVYAALQSGGVDVLLDDRDERPGVKFADADLIGAPLRLTVSPKSLAAGGVECKARCGAEAQIIPLAGLLNFVREELGRRAEWRGTAA